jgi:ankyrin repeat protein
MALHLLLQDGETPLYVAARFGKDNVAKVLLSEGAEVNIPNMVRTRFPAPPPRCTATVDDV